MALTVRYFSTSSAGAGDGTTWADRAALFSSGNWSSIITGHDFTSSGLRCRVGPGTYSCSQLLQNSLFTNAPTADKPLIVEGADSSGDRLSSPMPWVSAQPVWDDSSQPVISTTVALTESPSVCYYIFRNLKVTSSTSPGVNVAQCQNGYWDWIFLDTSWSHNTSAAFGRGANCWPTNCCHHHSGDRGNGLYYQSEFAANFRTVQTAASVTSGSGFYLGNSGGWQEMFDCTAIGWADNGFRSYHGTGGVNRLWRCIAAGIRTGPGFSFLRTTTPTLFGEVHNCIAVGCGTYGVDASGSAVAALVANSYLRGNTSGNINGAGDVPTDMNNLLSVGSDAQDFVDATNSDLTLRDYRIKADSPYLGRFESDVPGPSGGGGQTMLIAPKGSRPDTGTHRQWQLKPTG